MMYHLQSGLCIHRFSRNNIWRSPNSHLCCHSELAHSDHAANPERKNNGSGIRVYCGKKLPVSFVENSEFRKLMVIMEPSYVVPQKSTIGTCPAFDILNLIMLLEHSSLDTAFYVFFKTAYSTFQREK